MALPDVGWAAFDANGDLLFAVGGRLFRCPAGGLRAVVGLDEAITRSRLLADFTDLTFRPLAAPYEACRTEAGGDGDGGFVPALDRVTKFDRRVRQRAQRLLRQRQAKRPDG